MTNKVYPYALLHDPAAGTADMVIRLDGEWYRKEDYEALLAEHEALQARVAELEQFEVYASQVIAAVLNEQDVEANLLMTATIHLSAKYQDALKNKDATDENK